MIRHKVQCSWKKEQSGGPEETSVPSFKYTASESFEQGDPVIALPLRRMTVAPEEEWFGEE